MNKFGAVRDSFELKSWSKIRLKQSDAAQRLSHYLSSWNISCTVWQYLPLPFVVR